MFSNVSPGSPQVVTQLSVAEDAPEQDLPPHRGGGLVQVLERLRVPVAAFSLSQVQALQLLHADQPPLTTLPDDESIMV